MALLVVKGSLREAEGAPQRHRVIVIASSALPNGYWPLTFLAHEEPLTLAIVHQVIHVAPLGLHGGVEQPIVLFFGLEVDVLSISELLARLTEISREFLFASSCSVISFRNRLGKSWVLKGQTQSHELLPRLLPFVILV